MSRAEYGQKGCLGADISRTAKNKGLNFTAKVQYGSHLHNSHHWLGLATQFIRFVVSSFERLPWYWRERIFGGLADRRGMGLAFNLQPFERREVLKDSLRQGAELVFIQVPS